MAIGPGPRSGHGPPAQPPNGFPPFEQDDERVRRGGDRRRAARSTAPPSSTFDYRMFATVTASAHRPSRGAAITAPSSTIEQPHADRQVGIIPETFRAPHTANSAAGTAGRGRRRATAQSASPRPRRSRPQRKSTFSRIARRVPASGARPSGVRIRTQTRAVGKNSRHQATSSRWPSRRSPAELRFRQQDSSSSGSCPRQRPRRG